MKLKQFQCFISVLFHHVRRALYIVVNSVQCLSYWCYSTRVADISEFCNYLLAPVSMNVDPSDQHGSDI